MKAPTTAQIKAAKKQIAELDENLGLVREGFMAATKKTKPKFERLINKLLDERLEAMAIRDYGKKKANAEP